MYTDWYLAGRYITFDSRYELILARACPISSLHELIIVFLIYKVMIVSVPIQLNCFKIVVNSIYIIKTCKKLKLPRWDSIYFPLFIIILRLCKTNFKEKSLLERTVVPKRKDVYRLHNFDWFERKRQNDILIFKSKCIKWTRIKWKY